MTEPVPSQPDAGTDAAATTPTTQEGSDVGVFNFDTRTVMLNSGYALPLNGLGTYSLHGEECVSSVRAAIDAGVRLFDTASRGHTAELLGDLVIAEVAAAHGVSPAQAILRWNLQKGVVVIPGSSNPDHIRENAELYHFGLTDEEMGRIVGVNNLLAHNS